MARTKLLNLVSFLLKLGGEDLYRDSPVTRFVTYSSLFSILWFLILGVIDPILSPSVENLIDAYELFGPYFQTSTKIIVHRYYIKYIRNLLKTVEEKYWPLNKFGPELERKQIRLQNFLYCSFLVLLLAIDCYAVVLIVRPFLLSERSLPFPCYEILDNSNTVYYVFIFAWQMILFYFGPILVVGFDGLFVYFVSQTLCQLQMLKKGLKDLNIEMIRTRKDEDICMDKIRLYVEHHHMLLRVLDELRKIYSIILLNQFAASTASVCIGMYVFSSEGFENLLVVARGGIMTATFIFQLSIFCYAGSAIEDICASVSHASFYSGWNVTNRRRIKMCMLMMIKRAQKHQTLTAAGILSVDLTTLPLILQTAISFYTLMNSVNNKN